MKIFIFLTWAIIALFIIIPGFMLLFEIQSIITLGNRAEDSLMAAGWTGFSEINLMEMAKRKNLGNMEGRNNYLDKTEATNLVTYYIKKNLKLDDSLKPTEESYIDIKDKPVIIDEITIYNPDELPATSSEGFLMNETTIHIVVRIPLETTFTGFRYAPKSVHVNTDSFLTSEQK